MDYLDGIPALQTGDPISLTPQYSQELRGFIRGTDGWQSLPIAAAGWGVGSALLRVRAGVAQFIVDIARGTATTAATLAVVPANYRTTQAFRDSGIFFTGYPLSLAQVTYSTNGNIAVHFDESAVGTTHALRFTHMWIAG